MNINAVIQPAGFVLPVSLQLFDMLMVEAGEKTASKHRITAVTLNFRDPNYSAERGGYHPVEIRLVRGVISCLDRFTREAPRGAGAPVTSRQRSQEPKIEETGDDS